jgi:DNA-binding response OmpR family regulator
MERNVRTVLIIDDHVPTLESLTLVLQTNQFRVLSAETAKQAQEQFARNDVDLVIVDHGLPGISGTELAEQFKQVRNIPVLMLSGNPQLQGKPDSVDVLLAKPCSVPELFEAIDRLLAS